VNLYQVLSNSLQQLDRDRVTFCAYSGNVDWVITLRGDDFLVFQNEVGFWPTFFSEQLYQPEIKSVSDIINYVIYFLHTNSGGEGDLQEPKIVKEVMNLLRGYFSIGGTGAQAANFLAHLGCSKINLHLPIYNTYFQKVLHPSLRIYDNTPFYFKKLGEEIFSLSEIHCIFDYAAGTVYRIGNDIFQTKKADRVILSNDRCNSDIYISEAFKQELLKPHMNMNSSFLVSGFNLVRKMEDLIRFVKENQLIIEHFRKAHPFSSSIHLEEGDHWDKEKERREIISSAIYPLVDSLGMNKREFERITFLNNLKNDDPIQSLYAMACSYGLKRVGVHSSEYCLVVSSYPTEQEMLADGLGILLSAAKAYYGSFIGTDELERFLNLTHDLALSKEVYYPRPLGNGYYAFRIPTLEGIPVSSSLGLGDAFTAGLLPYL